MKRKKAPREKKKTKRGKNKVSDYEKFLLAILQRKRKFSMEKLDKSRDKLKNREEEKKTAEKCSLSGKSSWMLIRNEVKTMERQRREGEPRRTQTKRR